jgi:hypothetical protein
MSFDLMRFEIYLGLKNHKLLLQAFLVWTEEMILPVVYLQIIVVAVVDRLPSLVTSITNMTSLVHLSAMVVQLIISVETKPTESALRMSLESALVNSPRMVVAKLFMLA